MQLVTFPGSSDSIVRNGAPSEMSDVEHSEEKEMMKSRCIQQGIKWSLEVLWLIWHGIAQLLGLSSSF